MGGDDAQDAGVRVAAGVGSGGAVAVVHVDEHILLNDEGMAASEGFLILLGREVGGRWSVRAEVSTWAN